MHQSQLLVSPDVRLGFALLTVFGGVGVLLYLAPGGPVPQRPAERRADPLVERGAGWSARHKRTAVFGWLLLAFCSLRTRPARRPRLVRPPLAPPPAGSADRPAPPAGWLSGRAGGRGLGRRGYPSR